MVMIHELRNPTLGSDCWSTSVNESGGNTKVIDKIDDPLSLYSFRAFANESIVADGNWQLVVLLLER